MISYILFLSSFQIIIAFLMILINVTKYKISFFSFNNIFIIMNVTMSSLIFPILYITKKVPKNTSDYEVIDILTYFVCNLLLVIGVNIGYMVTLKKKNNTQKMYIKKINIRVLRRIIWLYLIVGLGLYLLYLSAYGSYNNYINHSLAIRIGYMSVKNKFSFLQPFGEFSQISTLCFMALLFINNEKKKKSDLIGFIVSFIFAIGVLYANKGRLAMMVFFLVLGLSFINILVSNRIFRSLLVGGICIFGFVALEFINKILNRGTYLSFTDMILGGLSFVPNNFFYWIKNLNISNARYMIDILLIPVFFLPSRIWSSFFGIRTVSELNTKALTGYFKGTGGVTGETPVDLLTLGYIQLGIIGVLIIGILFGKLLKYIDKKLFSIEIASFKIVIYYYIVFQVIMRTILIGDPENVVTRLFAAICFILLYRLISKLKF